MGEPGCLCECADAFWLCLLWGLCCEPGSLLSQLAAVPRTIHRVKAERWAGAGPEAAGVPHVDREARRTCTPVARGLSREEAQHPAPMQAPRRGRAPALHRVWARYGETHVCLGRASAHCTASAHQPRDRCCLLDTAAVASVPGAALGFAWKPSGQDSAEQGAAGAQPVARARWRWGVPRALGSERVRAWPGACMDDPPSGSSAGEGLRGNACSPRTGKLSMF